MTFPSFLHPPPQPVGGGDAAIGVKPVIVGGEAEIIGTSAAIGTIKRSLGLRETCGTGKSGVSSEPDPEIGSGAMVIGMMSWCERISETRDDEIRSAFSGGEIGRSRETWGRGISASGMSAGGGGKIGKYLKQKKPKINSIGWQHTRVDNNKKTNKAQASRLCGTASHLSSV